MVFPEIAAALVLAATNKPVKGSFLDELILKDLLPPKLDNSELSEQTNSTYDCSCSKIKGAS
jgi:hypothetical protein